MNIVLFPYHLSLEEQLKAAAAGDCTARKLMSTFKSGQTCNVPGYASKNSTDAEQVLSLLNDNQYHYTDLALLLPLLSM